jgi:hypothetical protein
MLAFSDLETRIPQDHPLRTIKQSADDALTALSPTFNDMCAVNGRPSIAPERVLKASLLISLYSVHAGSRAGPAVRALRPRQLEMAQHLSAPAISPEEPPESEMGILQETISRSGSRPTPRLPQDAVSD